MPPEPVVFTASDVVEIASKLTLDGATFVIGGQATNFWAWFYADRHPDLSSDMPFTSQDIDYYGSLTAARDLAAALGGEVKRPTGDDMNTPNTAIVEAVFKGKPLRIDFLNSVLGVNKKALEAGITEVTVAALIGNEDRQVQIAVMNPMNCLKSRIGNMMSVATKRRDSLAFRQLHASVAVAGVYIHDAIEEGEMKEAQACLREIFEYIRSHEFGREADAELGIDVLGIIREFQDDTRLDKRYRDITLSSMISRIEKDRAGRAERRAATAARKVSNQVSVT